MSILTSDSIVVSVAYDASSGFLNTGRERSEVTIESAGLTSLASDCGCNVEDINSVFMVFEHTVDGDKEVLRMQKFGSETSLKGQLDGGATDNEGTYEEKFRIVTLSIGPAIKFYKETNLTSPESFVFIKRDGSGDVIWDCGPIVSPHEDSLDGGPADEEPTGPSLDGGTL